MDIGQNTYKIELRPTTSVATSTHSRTTACAATGPVQSGCGHCPPASLLLAPLPTQNLSRESQMFTKPIIYDTLFLISPKSSFPLPITSNQGIPEAFPFFLLQNIYIPLTVVESLPAASDAGLLPCNSQLSINSLLVLVWVVFIYFQRRK